MKFIKSEYFLTLFFSVSFTSPYKWIKIMCLPEILHLGVPKYYLYIREHAQIDFMYSGFRCKINLYLLAADI